MSPITFTFTTEADATERGQTLIGPGTARGRDR